MTVNDQLSVIRRGTAEIVMESELRAKLERSLQSGVPLRVKLGLDPTAPDLHLGHTVVLQKLKDFQTLGHQAIIVIGDFTGMIGDPSGRSETRRPLTRAEIEANAETYRSQLGKILDMGRTRVEFNSSWLAPLKLEDLIRLTATFTVAQMLQRDDFAARHAAQRPISLHEFLYPICQAYDSVALGADVELGGTDQTFNLLVGRDLQRGMGQEPQVAVTVPILEGLDGTQKMSKSLGNYVGITEPPGEIYGKLMSIPDSLMLRYLTLVTRLAEVEIREIAQALAAGDLHPMEAKKRLARAVVAQYHGEAAAAESAQEFARVHQERALPEEVPFKEIPAPPGTRGEEVPLVGLLTAAGLVGSSSEARRLVQQGGIYVDGERVSDPLLRLKVSPGGKGVLLQVGRRKFLRVRVTPPAGDSRSG
ncbi:MAG: tyrosine--tRNA ligase [Candidatus Rokubacteria bacterium]|nr:tyrosine--tRNA ligase [Candidatus Rokubacteria bacterium]